jgi:hypothetical protein
MREKNNNYLYNLIVILSMNILDGEIRVIYSCLR